MEQVTENTVVETDGEATSEATSEAPTKTTIRPDVSKMVKTGSGSYHKDDFLGNTLAGLSVEQVKQIAEQVGVEVGKYAHLNPGQQRMNIGNTLRKLVADTDERGLEGASLDKAVAANLASEKVRDKIEELATGMKAANAEAEAAEKAEKAAAAEAKAAAKEAAKKTKPAETAPADGEQKAE